jgi:hypothetical protein
VGEKINEIGRFQGHFSEGRQKWLYFNCCISWPLVSYATNFFNYEDPRKSRRGPSCPESAYEGKIFRWNTPVISCAAEVQEQ